MIAYCIEEKRSYTIRIRAGKTRVRILDYDAMMLSYDGSVRLIIAEPLYFSLLQPIENGSMQIISRRNSNDSCRIYYCCSDDRFDRLEKYETVSSLITIGSGPRDTICISDRNIKPAQISVDLSKHTISDSMNQGIISLNHYPIQNSRYEFGDLIQIFSLRLSIQPFCILMNSGENIFHNLMVFAEIQPTVFLNTSTEREIERNCLERFFNLSTEEEISEYENLPAANNYPLFLSIGPILTMSSASLIAGILNGYSSYMNGREIIEILPMLLLPSIMIFSTLLWNPLQRFYEKRKIRKAIKKRKESFESELMQMKDRYDCLADKWLHRVKELFPDCNDFLRLDRIETLLWQKDRNRDDWLTIQIGQGDQKRNITISNANTVKRSDPIYPMMKDFINDTGIMKNQPVLLNLKGIKCCAIESEEYLDPFFIGLFLQIITLFGPDQLQIAVICDSDWLKSHEWIKSIPHLIEENSGIRMIGTAQKHAQYIADCINRSSKDTILFVQNHDIAMDKLRTDVHTVHISDELNVLFDSCTCRITVYDDHASMRFCDSECIEFEYQHLHMNLQNYANWIRCHRIKNSSFNVANTNTSFFNLYQITDADELKIAERWKHNKTRDMIAAPIGRDERSDLITINLHEKANGPHGLIAGTTGSGKSEWIITLILSLSVNYSCREVQFVLIDFKGGGISNVFDNEIHHLPHLAGIITNLSESEINRASVSFKNEILRRETLLKKLSDIRGIPIMNTDSYQKCWDADCGLPYMCHLIIVIDEFAELKKECPQFLSDMISMARVGRSLGIHLILCTQKPAGVVDEQIWSNSRFKVCLKVQEDSDSMEMIHIKDASAIANPGTFYMLCDGKLKYGFAAYSHAPVIDRTVSILNEMMETENALSQRNETEKTQIRAVMDTIMKSAEPDMKAHRLWMDHLKAEKIEDIEEEGALIIGREDDFYHREQPLLSFSIRKDQNAAVFSIERHEKIELIHILMYGLLSITDANDEIYIIDDLGCELESYMECAQTTDILLSDQFEKMNNLLKHLKDRNQNDQNSVYVLITHMTSFYEASEDNAGKLNALLELSSKKNFYFYLFGNAASSIRNRDLSSIPFRISLYNENLQDVRSIFETSENSVQTKRHFGLIRKDRIIEFRMPLLTAEREAERIAETTKRCGKEKHYAIPFIPEHILKNEYQGNGIGIGINIQNYHWAYLDRSEMHMILATEIDELQRIYDIHKESENVTWRPELHESEKIAAERRDGMIFMLYQDFQNSVFENHESVRTIVYYGKGFARQYRFSITGKQELKSNQCAVFRDGRAEVVQIAENE